MIARVNGTELYYEKTGAGRPLVMVHGNGEDHTIFMEAAEVLKDRFTCYLVDSRSHGLSAPAPELHYADMAADMAAFLELLGLQDAVFYGFSDGGIVGLLTAANCGRIGTLIVSGTNLTPKGVCLRMRLYFRFLWLKSRDPLIRLMMREPQIGDDTLKSIAADTLVLAGSRDLIREKETLHIAETIPGAKLAILQGEDHGSYIVHQSRIGEIIRAFALEGKVPDGGVS